ncbi:MAG TPA: glycerophosphodiester phosphodiesterase, partial [Candidatus Saccharimonadales bacterium]|nr:glycerophosphodiester phosphodiesterase [Candidatus Saccharimonadales bacterium]
MRTMKIIGHRGARGLAPENTLAAIEAGIKAGADEIEVDVRVTKDGIPVLWHDKTLQGQTVAQSVYADLKTAKPDLVTLSEALHHIASRTPVILEVKPDEPVAPIIAVVKKYLGSGGHASDLRFGSFSQKTLLGLHKAMPTIRTIVIERWSGVRAAWRAHQLGTKYICMNYKFLWWGFIKSMANSG